VLIGLPSSGLHSNGYSLARKVLLEAAGFKADTYLDQLGRTVGEEMLEPTRIYVKAVLPLLEKFDIKGMAHITGGGLTENIIRVLPEGTGITIKLGTWDIPPVFDLIREMGSIEELEMLRTFNMGIGLVAIVAASQAEAIRAEMTARGEASCLIGEVIEGRKEVSYI
jgi:phosphoribosylformylglycinamidine cyclo-ligase